jgi:hypothetical protein
VSYPLLRTSGDSFNCEERKLNPFAVNCTRNTRSTRLQLAALPRREMFWPILQERLAPAITASVVYDIEAWSDACDASMDYDSTCAKTIYPVLTSQASRVPLRWSKSRRATGILRFCR